MPRPAMRLRILPRFPAQVQATAPVVVTKTGGTYLFTADYRPVGEETAPPLNTYALVLQNQTTGAFVRTLLADLPTGSTDWANIQNRPTKIDELATLDTSQGAVEQTGANSFAKRTIGGGGPTSLVTYGDANLFYQPISGRLTTIVSTGVQTADIVNDAVTFAKMQNIATSRLLGRTTASSGDVEEITLTGIIDAAIGATQGNVLYRAASAWAVLAPGTAGYVLQTNGAAANPSWAPPSSGSAPLPQTAAGVGQFVTSSGASGAAFTLPAGGTWVWWGFGANSGTGAINNLASTGVSAGGTAVLAATGSTGWFAFAWRIT